MKSYTDLSQPKVLATTLSLEMEDFTLDTKGFLNEMMPNIHANNYISQDIKDAWIELCVVENVDLIIEEVCI